MHRTLNSITASHAAHARWAVVRAARAAEPVRETRVVEIEVRDSHRPRATVRMVAQETPRGWSRWQVSQNGVRIGRRTCGRTSVGKLVARWLA